VEVEAEEEYGFFGRPFGLLRVGLTHEQGGGQVYGIEAPEGVLLLETAGSADEVVRCFGRVEGLPVLVKRFDGFPMLFGGERALSELAGERRAGLSVGDDGEVATASASSTARSRVSVPPSSA